MQHEFVYAPMWPNRWTYGQHAKKGRSSENGEDKSTGFTSASHHLHFHRNSGLRCRFLLARAEKVANDWQVTCLLILKNSWDVTRGCRAKAVIQLEPGSISKETSVLS